MKKNLRLLALFMALALTLSGVSIAAGENEISPYTNNYIQSLAASVSKSGTTLYVSFAVYGTGVMKSIGASRIDLYTSSGNLVKTFYSSAYATMLGSNCALYSSSVSYPGTKGTTYYAVVTAYAANDTGSGTEYYTTGSITL